jgi:hypothetical protein
MRQVNVGLPDDLRARLDEASSAANRGLAEEIRDRLAQSFVGQEIDDATKMLLAQIGRLGSLMRPQTGHDWAANAGSHHVFQQAVALLLARNKPAGDPKLNPAELPADRPVAVTNLEAMAAGLEAIVSADRLTSRMFETPRSPPAPTTAKTNPYARGAVSPLGGQAKSSREDKKR